MRRSLRSLIGGPTRVLDLGCSTGDFLASAHNAGREVFGIDVSQFAIERSRQRLPVEPDRFECEATPDSRLVRVGNFDAITLWDVAEHLPEPVEEFRRLAAALSPVGVLVIRSPHTGSPLVQLATWLCRASLSKMSSPLAAFMHQDHYFLFSASGLEAALRQLGLGIVHSSVDGVGWRRFRYAECRRGAPMNLLLAAIWAAGKIFGRGHGIIVAASRVDRFREKIL